MRITAIIPFINNLHPLFLRRIVLLRRNTVQEYCDDGEDHVRQPEGDERREGSGMDEHLAETQEEDVGERQGDADTDVPADSAASLLR